MQSNRWKNLSCCSSSWSKAAIDEVYGWCHVEDHCSSTPFHYSSVTSFGFDTACFFIVRLHMYNQIYSTNDLALQDHNERQLIYVSWRSRRLTYAKLHHLTWTIVSWASRICILSSIFNVHPFLVRRPRLTILFCRESLCCYRTKLCYTILNPMNPICLAALDLLATERCVILERIWPHVCSAAGFLPI